MNHSVAHVAINIWWFEATWFCNKMKSHSAAHAVNKNLQFCNEPFSCSCCNQYLMFWSNKMKSYSAAIAVNKNLQFMQYTLSGRRSALLSSFPWTTQKSIIVENSKIVEIFGATIFLLLWSSTVYCKMLCPRQVIWIFLLSTSRTRHGQPVVWVWVSWDFCVLKTSLTSEITTNHLWDQ